MYYTRACAKGVHRSTGGGIARVSPYRKGLRSISATDSARFSVGRVRRKQAENSEIGDPATRACRPLVLKITWITMLSQV